MKINKVVLFLVLGSLLLVLAGGARAQVSALTAYDISWFSIDGGGGVSSGGSYSLNATIGQPDAGSMSGGSYTLNGGFWAGGAPPLVKVYLPLLDK